MPTLKLTDKLGFVTDIQFPEDASILKYIRELKEINVSGLNLATLQRVPLDKVPLDKASGGLSFAQPVDVGIDQLEMTIKTEGSGQLKLTGPKDKQLFDPELFGDPISRLSAVFSLC